MQYHNSGTFAGHTTVQGDVNGDGTADFTILADGNEVHFDNFVY